MSIPIKLAEQRPIIFYKDEKIYPLVQEEVQRRQKIFGKNTIEKHSSRSWIFNLLDSLFDPFNVLLIGISCLSIFLNDIQSFVIMIIMVLISGGIRFFQTQQSATKLNDLTSIVKKNITVIRSNSFVEFEEIVDLSDCVPGDFIKLNAGDRVPADIQLIKTNCLFVDQSLLTGEPNPCLKFVKEPKLVKIDYDLINEKSIHSIKKKTILSKISHFLFNCLKDNFGLDYPNPKIKFDSHILIQFDKNDLLFMGTSVISGTGLGVVLATGKRTFFGVMSEQISYHKPLSTFNKGIKQISLVFIFLMVIITIPIILIKGFNIFNVDDNLKTSERWIHAAQFALSVAVGLTPEMLPCICSMNLAKGTFNLSSKNCIVKRIDSISNLGSMNILCTDKTGTLTENFIQLVNVFNFKKQDCLIGLELAFLNSAYQDAFKNLTDQAIINAYEQKQISLIDLKDKVRIHKIREIPFDFNRRKVTVVYELSEFDICILITKGAVNEMLEVCSHYLDKDEDDQFLSLDDLFKTLKATSLEEDNLSKKYKLKPMTPDIIDQLHQLNDNLNQDGYRVLAVAYKLETNSKIKKDEVTNNKSNLEEKDLIFVSYLTFLNPSKKSAAKAIRDLISNNVKVKVLTGDTQEVCKNVCKQIGLSTNLIINSKQLNKLNESEFKEASASNVIFSQLTPIQKFEIVRLLRGLGHVVGFLGDGINDVLALKEADVGISVDSGTEIAKDAADIILLEKELDVINVGLFCGRRAYINIIKYISMAISGNFGNVISICIAVFTLPFLPMAPIHILLQNLLYDIGQIVMPWDNVDENLIGKPEVFKLRNLINFMLFWGPISSFFDCLTFLFLYFNYKIKTDKDNVSLFQTGFFTVGVLTQTLVCHILRTHKLPIVQSNASYIVYLSTITTLTFGLILPLTSFGNLFNMVQLPISFYYFLIFILVTYCLTVQLLKRLYVWIFNSWFTNL